MQRGKRGPSVKELRRAQAKAGPPHQRLPQQSSSNSQNGWAKQAKRQHVQLERQTSSLAGNWLQGTLALTMDSLLVNRCTPKPVSTGALDAPHNRPAWRLAGLHRPSLKPSQLGHQDWPSLSSLFHGSACARATFLHCLCLGERVTLSDCTKLL